MWVSESESLIDTLTQYKTYHMTVINIGQNCDSLNQKPGNYFHILSFLMGNLEDQVRNGQHSQCKHRCTIMSLKVLAIKEVVMPTLQSRLPLLWLMLLFLFCVMSALESSSLWGMTLVMLGHAADNGDFQQGEVTSL